MTYYVEIDILHTQHISYYLDDIPFFFRNTAKDNLREISNFIRHSTNENGITMLNKTIYNKQCTATCYKTIDKTIIIITDDKFDKSAIRSMIGELKMCSTKDMLDKFIKNNQQEKKNKINELNDTLGEIKTIMIHNIDELLARGESLDSLLIKSKDLQTHSVIFERKATKMNRCCILL
jgi:hypothetical protein